MPRKILTLQQPARGLSSNFCFIGRIVSPTRWSSSEYPVPDAHLVNNGFLLRALHFIQLDVM